MSHEYIEARHKPRLCAIHFRMPPRLRMELDVPVADYALRSDLAHRTGHRDAKLIVDARLAIVLYGHTEGAIVAAGAGEQDRLGRAVWVECDHHDFVDRAIDVQPVYVIDIVEVAARAAVACSRVEAEARSA